MIVGGCNLSEHFDAEVDHFAACALLLKERFHLFPVKD